MADRLVFALGSNRGDRHQFLRRAREVFEERTSLCRCSTIIETPPQGIDSNRPFLNQVVEVDPAWQDLWVLRGWIHRVESSLGRRRDQATRDRRIDVDLLFWGDRIALKPLIVPHPRLHRRDFVLDPLVEINPARRHPRYQITVQELQHRNSTGEPPSE